MTDTTFVCATCGEEHTGLPQDYAFGLPDDVFSLKYLDRYLRSRSNADLATLDESRFFIRCVLPIPFVDSDEEFVWGLWAEVGKAEHDLYLKGFYEDLSAQPRFPARIANDIPSYETLGETVQVQFRDGSDRPTLFFPRSSRHPLAREQREGITRKRHHRILEAVGFFEHT